MERNTEIEKLFKEFFKSELRNGAKPGKLFQTPHEKKKLETIIFPDLVELDSETLGDPYEGSISLFKTCAQSMPSTCQEDLEKSKENCKDASELYIKVNELEKLEKKRFGSFKTTRDMLVHQTDNYKYGRGSRLNDGGDLSDDGEEESSDEESRDLFLNEIRKLERNLSKIKNEEYTEKLNGLLMNYNEIVHDEDEDDDRVSLVDMESDKDNEDIDVKMFTNNEDIDDFNRYFSIYNKTDDKKFLQQIVFDNVPSDIDNIFEKNNNIFEDKESRTDSALITKVCKELDDIFSDPVEIIIEESKKCFIDPLTKKPISDPVRNKICGHYYDKATIYILLCNRRSPCPYLGCSCKEFTKNDLEECRDHNITKKKELEDVEEKSTLEEMEDEFDGENSLDEAEMDNEFDGRNSLDEAEMDDEFDGENSLDETEMDDEFDG